MNAEFIDALEQIAKDKNMKQILIDAIDGTISAKGILEQQNVSVNIMRKPEALRYMQKRRLWKALK